jgi:hypothetical protein
LPGDGLRAPGRAGAEGRRVFGETVLSFLRRS